MKEPLFVVVLWTATLLSGGCPGAAWASADATPVEVSCPGMSREHAAAFEARARAELLVRGLSGSLRVSCGRDSLLTWTPTVGASRSARLATLSTDAMLMTLQSLLDGAVQEPLPSPPETVGSPPPSAKPEPAVRDQAQSPVGDVRLGAGARLLKDEPAVGAGLTAALHLEVLNLTASGHLTRGLKSFGSVSLYIAEMRIGAELVPLDSLRLGAGIGGGRPFTTVPAGVSRVGESPNAWFGEAYVRLATTLLRAGSLRFDLGTELTGYSRRVRMQVDRTTAYDFNLVPAIFLEAAFELQ